MKTITFSQKLLGIAAVSAALIPAMAVASYPNKPITMIVPFAPGGNLDITARAIAPALGQQLNTTVVVMNKPGAGGTIGATQVANSEPDGYTLLMTTPNAIAVAPLIAPTSYKAEDFRSVGMIAETPLLIDVHPKGPYQTLPELLKAACSKPGSVTVGHSGIGTTNHVAIINLQDATGCEFNAIAYKGSGPAIIDLAGGQLDFVIDQLSSSSNMIQGGKIKALAVMTEERVPSLKDVPTLKELGIKDIDASTRAGVLAPKDTPPAIITQLNEALQKAAVDETVKNALDRIGSISKSSTPEAFSHLIDKEIDEARRLSDAGKLNIQ